MNPCERFAPRKLLAAAALCLSSSLAAAIDVAPVASGLSSPLFVGHAGDGSNRLFIVERGGAIRVLQPGASTATVFLDIGSRIVSGGESGLLGLAFHPQYAGNGRFFVFYTRAGDGALVIAEYRVSSDPNVADPTETPLLTIPHPTHTNHNGGMLAFGPDGYLYIGVGDGGSANDPPNNARNLETLLGKILRIEVSRPGAYAIPADNPFVGVPGRDEIYAYGWRNPWRFSFDRATGAGWVADVGQDAREEVDTPIVVGGDYGWRVYEASACTGNDPLLCNPANYVAPLFDYAHTGVRCSITGGYVYRGSRGALPQGTYVYGDFCSGEIFGWNGGLQSVLLDTTMNISSFGEDEQGEIYVVGLGGTVGRIVASAGCSSAGCRLDQHGLTGIWHEPATSGQGFGIEVYPDLIAPGTGLIQVSWFTFDSGAAGGAEKQRWYTASGTAASGSTSASLAVYRNTGGNFDAGPVTAAQQVGTATLTFSTCDAARFTYAFADGSGRSGVIPLTRITPGVTCSTTSARLTNADFAMSGNWFDASTSGQGFFFELNPNSPVFYFAWYTYAPGGQSLGAAGQRWYTGQTAYAFGPRTRTFTMPIYETSGGIFDTATPAAQSTVVVGTATVTFASCEAATLAYTLSGGSSAGRSGTIGLTRVGPTGPGCAY